MNFLKPYRGCKPNQITCPFGHTSTNYHTTPHKGTDFGYEYGTPLVAPEDVLITKVTDAKVLSASLEELRKGYGLTMASQKSSGIIHLYWHCLPKFPVEAGQIKKQGEVVAYMGNSGLVYSAGVYVPLEERVKTKKGTHLHWEVYKKTGEKKEYFDPALHIDYNLEANYDLLTSIQNTIRAISNLLRR